MISRVGGWWRSVLGYVYPLPWGESSSSFLFLIRPFFDAHLSSVTSSHSLPLPSRVAWAILKYLGFSEHYCLCMHMYPSPECSLPSNFPICFDLTPCAAFLVYLPQVSSPWVAQGPFPLLCSSVLIPLSSTSYIDIHLLICSATTWVPWGCRAPYLAREDYLWKNVMAHQRLKARTAIL